MGNIASERVGWLAYLDIYGYSALLEHFLRDGQRLSAIVHQLVEAHTTCSRVLGQSSANVECYSFNDSLLLFAGEDTSDDRYDRLADMLEAVSMVQRIFLGYELPIRGGISHGEVVFNPPFILGLPLLQATNYEKEIEAPLVLLPAKECLQDNGKLSPLAPQMRPLPVRSGDMLGTVVIPDSFDLILDLTQKFHFQYALSGPPLIAAAWRVAYETLLGIQKKE